MMQNQHEAPRVDHEKLSGDRVGESSDLQRSQETPESIVCNADMGVGVVKKMLFAIISSGRNHETNIAAHTIYFCYFRLR